MNYNFCWWFFLYRSLLMVHIWNYCPRKVFDNNMFLILNKFSDNITIYWDWTGSWSWGWSSGRLIKSFCSSCWFYLSSVSFSSNSTFKWMVEGYKVVNIFIDWCFEFCSFHFEVFLNYCFCFGNIYFIFNFWWLA